MRAVIFTQIRRLSMQNLNGESTSDTSVILCQWDSKVDHQGSWVVSTACEPSRIGVLEEGPMINHTL